MHSNCRITGPSNSEKYKKGISLLNEYHVWEDVELYRKMKHYLDQELKNNKFEKMLVISDLPCKIKNDLLCEMYKDIISFYPFFKASTHGCFCLSILECFF